MFAWWVALVVLAAPSRAVWPMPASMVAGPSAAPLELCSGSLVFSASRTTPVLLSALARYRAVLFDLSPAPPCNGTLPVVTVKLSFSTSSPWPDRLDSTTDESYTLVLSTSGSTLSAVTPFGLMHGLETLAQLVERSTDRMWLPQVVVTDAPRFSFRGFLHDTSRHYLSVSVLKTLIDGLAMAKMNVFHWHIVDSQSFPYVSSALPRLSKGAWGGLASHTYTAAQVQEVIQYALERGVRVVPEFDTPGHTASWGVGYPELVTPCYTNGQPDGSTGPLNPTLNTTFAMLQALYIEIAQVFADDYMHIGGDEVSFDCWQSNPSVAKWMAARNWTDYALLEQYYEQSLIAIVETTKKHYVVWQEIFDNGLKISPKTVVDVWKGDWQGELASVTRAGFQAILSSPWYLNLTPDPYNGYKEPEGGWQQYYLTEPLDFNGTDAQKALVIGGEGCMWGEFTDNTNAVSNTWPRAATVGERLWSPRNVANTTEAAPRLARLSCEMIRRGIAAAPFATGPSYCPYEYQAARK